MSQRCSRLGLAGHACRGCARGDGGLSGCVVSGRSLPRSRIGGLFGGFLGRTHAVVIRSRMPVLLHVRDFMGQQGFSLRRIQRRGAGAPVNLSVLHERLGIQRIALFAGSAGIVDANISRIDAKGAFHSRSNRRWDFFCAVSLRKQTGRRGVSEAGA